MINDERKRHSQNEWMLIARHSNRPLAAVCLSFLIGIGFCSICRHYSFGLFAVACASMILASSLALRRKRLVLSLMLGLGAILICGLLMALAHRDGFSDIDLRCQTQQSIFPLDQPVLFDGCVVKECEQRGHDKITTVELRGFRQKDHWIACKGKAILRIAEPDPEDPQAPRAELLWGDRVRGWASWHIPRNYENPGSTDIAGLLARRGITLIGRVKSPRLLESIPGDCLKPWTHMAMAVRNRVRMSFGPIREKEKGQPAAILESLVIGDYSKLNNHTREVFQNAGVFHALVISGLHVAWIAGVLLYLLKFLCLQEQIRYLLAALSILLYTCVVGFQASVTRCLWIFVFYLIGRMIVRRADPVNILFAVALLLLAVEPDWLLEAGFQFSFLAVLAIATTAAPIIKKYLCPLLEPLRNSGNPLRLIFQPDPWYRRGRKLRIKCEIFIEGISDPLPPFACNILLSICRTLAGAAIALGSMIVVSLCVQIWLEPILAYYYNRISWISLLANVVIVPFSSLVLAVGIIASLAAEAPLCGPALVRLAETFSSMLLHGTTWITTLPGAWQRCPTPGSGWVFGCVVLLVMWRFFEWKRFWFPCTCSVVLLACLAHGSVPLAADPLREFKRMGRKEAEDIWRSRAPVLSFTFLDVGEGDSIIICFPNKNLWVLDAGGLGQAFSQQDAYTLDIGEAVVSRYLWHRWIIKLDRLILSHADLDHAGGMPAVMKNFKVGRFDYASTSIDEILDEILSIARKKHVPRTLIYAGSEEKVGGVTVRVLNPPRQSVRSSANENSVVLAFAFKRFSALLTGDLEKEGQDDVLSCSGKLRGLLLKVAHHGSRSGTSDAFLDRTQPLWAIVSAGRNNPYGHPSPEVVSRILRHGARPILTSDQGAVSFETDGVHYAIRSYMCGLLETGILE